MMPVWVIINAILFITIVLGIIAMIKYSKNGGLTDYRAVYIIGAIWTPLGIVFWTSQNNPAFFIMGAIFLFIGSKNKDKWDTHSEISPIKKKMLLVIFGITVLVVAYAVFMSFIQKRNIPQVTNFEECVTAGNPIIESYPQKCRYNDELFVKNIVSESEQADDIRIEIPSPNQIIETPLHITGEARGTWFFEGEFPVVLINRDGLIIAEGIATAQGEWMTEEFVPFTADINFDITEYGKIGTLILKKDNPSGLSENDDDIKIPVKFGSDIEPKVTLCKPEQRGAEVCTMDYTPVCGKVNVQCIKAPCPPQYQTFSNVCVACGNSLVESYTAGECDK